MLAEHSFVTLLESEVALKAAEELAFATGFAFVERAERHITARRGRAAARAKSIAELPLQLRLDFDRGRIDAAASLEVVGKSQPLHKDFLTTLLSLFEARLALGRAAAEVLPFWTDMEDRVRQDAARKRRRSWILVLVLVVFLVLLVSTCAMVVRP